MIQLHGIHQTYRGAQGPVQALRGVDLHVRLGEVFGVIGRSGAGKSSLVRTINLLNRPTQGEVWVDGSDLTAMKTDTLRAARKWAKWLSYQKFATNVRIMRGGLGGEEVV